MSCDCVVSVESSPRGGWGENKGRSSGKRGVELVRPGIACYTPPPPPSRSPIVGGDGMRTATSAVESSG